MLNQGSPTEKAAAMGTKKFLVAYVIGAVLMNSGVASADETDLAVAVAGPTPLVAAAHDYMWRGKDLIHNIGMVLSLCLENGACKDGAILTQNVKKDTITLNGQEFRSGSKHFGWLESFRVYSVNAGRVHFRAVPKENAVLGITTKDAFEGDFVAKSGDGRDYWDFEPLRSSGCAESKLGDICPWRDHYVDSRFQRELDPWYLINEYEWVHTYHRKIDDFLNKRIFKGLSLSFVIYGSEAPPGNAKKETYEIIRNEERIKRIEVSPYKWRGQDRLRLMFWIDWGLSKDSKIPFVDKAPMIGSSELVGVHFKGKKPHWFLRGAKISEDSGCHFTYYGDLCPVRWAHRFEAIGPKSGWGYKRFQADFFN